MACSDASYLPSGYTTPTERLGKEKHTAGATHGPEVIGSSEQTLMFN